MPADPILEALEDLIANERSAILKGDLDNLPGLLHEKERLMQVLSETDVASKERISRIQPLIARNRSLLDAALAGMRAAMCRLGARQQVRRTLSTYDKTGARNVVGQTNHRLEQRR